jgi:hypothetical protein
MTPHTVRTEEEKTRLAQEVIVYLNEVVALDPEAVHQLCEHRIPSNKKLAKHPTTQISYEETDSAQEVVGLLGILNGLVGVRPDQHGYITAVYGDNQKLQSFELTKKEYDSEFHPDVGGRPITEIDAEMIINGHRRRFVEGIQYYLNELMEDDSPLHVIGHIQSYCRDYEKLIRDAIKVHGQDTVSPSTVSPSEDDDFCSCGEDSSVCHSGLCGNCGKIGRD